MGRKQLDKKNTGNACMVVVISASVSKRDELASEEYFNRPQNYYSSISPASFLGARHLHGSSTSRVWSWTCTNTSPLSVEDSCL